MSSQFLERLLEHSARKMWAVAVEGNHAPSIVSREVRKYGSEARGKTFTFLRNHAHSTAWRFSAC
jgi:hypothetical protein